MNETPTNTTRAMRCTYGGLGCCATQPAFLVTRTNALGAVTYETCLDHRNEAAANASEYVDGWGDLSVTVAKNREAVSSR